MNSNSAAIYRTESSFSLILCFCELAPFGVVITATLANVMSTNIPIGADEIMSIRSVRPVTDLNAFRFFLY